MNSARLILTASALFLIGCNGPGKDEPVVDAPMASHATTVLVQEVVTGSFQLNIDLAGSSEAIREVNLGARIPGTVDRLPVALGERVKKGQLLIGLDPRTAQAQKKQAEAGLLAAKAALKKATLELERSRALFDKGRISSAEYEGVELGQMQAQAGAAQAGAALDLASLGLEYTEIRAPFSGDVALLAPEIGEDVGPGQPLAAVLDRSRIRVKGTLAERDAVRVEKGMDVLVTVPALGEETFSGRVTALGRRGSMATRSFPVEIEVDNPGGRILSGMALRCAIGVEQLDGVIAIPSGAIVEQYGESFAFIVRENTSYRRAVTLGATDGDRVVVTDGLSAGDKLIVRGQWIVRDGASVKIGSLGQTEESR